VSVAIADRLSLKAAQDQALQRIHRQRFRKRGGSGMMADNFIEKIAQILQLLRIVDRCFADAVGRLIPFQPVYPVGPGDKVDP
jgi:hypothetical protein